MKSANQIRAALAKAPLVSFTGPTYRVIDARFLATPLSGIGSFLSGSRFNPAGLFEVLYLAEDKTLAQLEVESLFHTGSGLVSARRPPEVMLTVDCRLSFILDVTDAALLSALGTTLDELRGPWRTFLGTKSLAPTHALGIAAHAIGKISAIRYTSAKDPARTNLAIFPDRLRKTESIVVHDPHNVLANVTLVGRLP